MTESRVFVLMGVLLIAFAIVCAITGQWLGAIGSLLGAQQSWSARWFLLKWKPETAAQ